MSNATLHNYDIFAQGLPYNDLLKTLPEETQVTHLNTSKVSQTATQRSMRTQLNSRSFRLHKVKN